MMISIAAAVEIRVSDRRATDAGNGADVNVVAVVTEDTFYRSAGLLFPPPEFVSRALIIDICALRFDEDFFVRVHAARVGYLQQRGMFLVIKGQANAELKP